MVLILYFSNAIEEVRLDEEKVIQAK